MFLDYFALGMLIFVSLVLFYGVIAIHDIPYEIAKERDHPHQDAIHYAGWVSLFTLHALWPFLWIWATLWRKERGWGFKQQNKLNHDLSLKMEQMDHELTKLKLELASLKKADSRGNDMTSQEGHH
ncbi:DUF3302 domain-containing protein [Vibrio sp. AK197]